MKKNSVIVIFLTLLMASCSLTKENKQYRSTLNGTWELTKVSYQGMKGKFSATLFQDADAKCFEGSTWFFKAINSLGYYELPQTENCIAEKQNIRWSITDKKQLQFKFIDEKRKDLDPYGFHLDIDYLDDTTMTLHSNANIEGKTIQVIYQFQKINKK